jgi:hypothetical protein
MADHSSKKTKKPRSSRVTQQSTCSKRTKRTVAEPPPLTVPADERTVLEETDSEPYDSDEELMCPALQITGDADSDDEDEDEVEFFPNDLLNPDANAGDVICHCLSAHGWSLSLSRDFYCAATELSYEDFDRVFKGYPLVHIRSIMEFYGYPAYVERGFIAAINAIRKSNPRCRKITAKECFVATFQFENQKLYCEILPLTKTITVCAMDER